MTPTSDFSGFMISSCAFASAAAIAPTDSLERCIAALEFQGIDSHRPRFRPFRSNAVPGRLLGVCRHQGLEFSLGIFMLDVCLSRASKDAGEFGPGIRGVHVHD